MSQARRGASCTVRSTERFCLSVPWPLSTRSWKQHAESQIIQQRRGPVMAHMESTCTPSASNPALRSGVQRSVFFPARALDPAFLHPIAFHDGSPCHLAPGSRLAAGPGPGARAHQQPPRRPHLCGSLDYLHSGGLAGTKGACGQGGCSACTVHIVDDQGKATPVNACLKPMGVLDENQV